MLTFEVVYSEWVADGEVFSANDNPHEIERPSEALLTLAGSAHHAGAIRVEDGLEDGHVQSQEDGELALVEAMGEWVGEKRLEDGTSEPGYWSGPWGESNRAQAADDENARAKVGITVDTDEGEAT